MQQKTFYRAEIDLGFVAYVFEPGRRLLVRMYGSSYPRFNVNTNFACVLFNRQSLSSLTALIGSGLIRDQYDYRDSTGQLVIGHGDNSNLTTLYLPRVNLTDIPNNYKPTGASASFGNFVDAVVNMF